MAIADASAVKIPTFLVSDLMATPVMRSSSTDMVTIFAIVIMVTETAVELSDVVRFYLASSISIWCMEPMAI